MSLRLLTTLLALLPGVVLAAPGIVASETVTVMPVSGDARPQLHPAVAHDGKDTYLVVWQQGRFYHQSQSADIFAARVDGRGRVLDRQPIVVCNAAASQERPQVAYSGGRFLVVWHDLRNGLDWDVYAARVGLDGRVLDPGGFRIAGGAENQASPVVAPAQNGFLVVWQHYDRHYRLQAATIPVSGPAGSPHALKYRGEALWGGELALVRAGDGWLLSWNDETDWVKGDMVTRRFGRVALRGERPAMLEVQRAPSVHVGREGGRFASDGASTALYAGWGIVGRGKRAATAARFAADRAVALANPNREKAARGSGWDAERVMSLYDFSVAVDGPVAVAHGQGVYLAIARQAYLGKPADRSRLLGSRVTAAGVRLDHPPFWPVVHESPQRVGNPVLAGGRQAFLLAFEEEDSTGRRQIRAKILKAE